MEPLSEPLPATLPVAADPVLSDRWEPGLPIPLDGRLERSRFPPWLTALFGLIIAFILFQVLISPVVTVALLLYQGVQLGDLLTQLPQIIEEHAGALLIANTVGQVFGLALPALLLATLHSSRKAAFLRFRSVPWTLLIQAVVGLLLLYPIVQWFGQWSDGLPWPESIRGFEQAQLELIEKVLSQDMGLLFTLSVLALTPAFCEELLFRGYVQRQAERSMGVAWGIVFSGVIFGLYHLRLTQALPLSLLGIYLAYLVWRTGSLWPAILVHFVNNAAAVFIGEYVKAKPELELADLEQIEMPWFLIIIAPILFSLLIMAMQRTAGVLIGSAPYVEE